ncbi:MAG: hypothetical protein AB7D57_15445, partial [Desulfovibrionaceae bacterium]
LVRHLLDRGVDAELLLLDAEVGHFLPENDIVEDGRSPRVRSLAWGSVRSFGLPAREVRASLQDYDILFGSGSSPAFAHKAGRRLDVFSPSGGDIFFMPFLRHVRPSRYLLRNLALARHQMHGIREARHLFLCPTDDEYERHIGRVRYRGRRVRAMLPTVYTPVYNPQFLERYGDACAWLPRFRALRERCGLMVFHHTRHMWTATDGCCHTKGNDILVRGFARFVQAHPDARAVLVMFEYGEDHPATRELVRRLGIEASVEWFPVLPRKEIMAGLALCDIASNEFHDGWIGGGTAMEAMAMAKPILQYRNDEMNLRHFPELSPTVNVRTAEQIADALEDCRRNPEKYAEIGRAGCLWHQRYCIDRTLDAYLDAIRQREEGAPPAGEERP